jgi:hypothetical protein
MNNEKEKQIKQEKVVVGTPYKDLLIYHGIGTGIHSNK